MRNKMPWVILALSAALFISSFAGRAQSVNPGYDNYGYEPFIPTGSTVAADGIRLRYVQTPPVTCGEATRGTIVILGFTSVRWQTCICDGKGGDNYDWEDFFDGGYCAWEGPV